MWPTPMNGWSLKILTAIFQYSNLLYRLFGSISLCMKEVSFRVRYATIPPDVITGTNATTSLQALTMNSNIATVTPTHTPRVAFTISPTAMMVNMTMPPTDLCWLHLRMANGTPRAINMPASEG